MPPLPPTPSPVLKVTINWNVDGDTGALTRFYLSFSGASPSSTDIQTFLAAITTTWNSHIVPLYPATTTAISATGQDLSSSSGAVGVSNWNIIGGRSGTAASRNNTVNVHYQITRHYRGGKPKGFWPFGNQSDITSGKSWTSTFQTSVASGLGSMFTDIIALPLGSGSILQQVNVSYYSGFHVVTSPTTGRARNVPDRRATPVVDNITGRVVQPTIGSQRRRLYA